VRSDLQPRLPLAQCVPVRPAVRDAMGNPSSGSAAASALSAATYSAHALGAQ